MATKSYKAEDIQAILDRYSQPGTLVRVTLEGIAPGFLMHNGQAQFHQDAAKTEHQAKGGRGKFIPAPELEAEWGTYRMLDGTLCLPAKVITRALVEAGKAFKEDGKRTSLKYAVAASVTTPMSAADGFALLDPETDAPISDYTLDLQKVVVQRASVQRARPLIEEWKAEVEFLLDTANMNVPTLASLIAYAGARVGVGDNRPEKAGVYGRFRVISFEVEEDS